MQTIEKVKAGYSISKLIVIMLFIPHCGTRFADGAFNEIIRHQNCAHTFCTTNYSPDPLFELAAGRLIRCRRAIAATRCIGFPDLTVYSRCRAADPGLY